MMMLQNTGQEELEISGLKVRGIEEETVGAKFDLTLNMGEGREGIGGALEYSLDLYEGETIRRMARHYERVVGEMVRDAERGIREIELMSEQEKRQIINGWSRTKIEFERDRCIHHLFEAQAERSPESVAVVCEGEQISYRELNRRANQLGHYLKGLGVRPEMMVGVCLERSIELAVALMGVWKAGGVYVPMDPSYPEQRLRFMAEDADVGVMVTGGRESARLDRDQLRVLDLEEEWKQVANCSDENPSSEVSGESLAYVIYTSGSTQRRHGGAQKSDQPDDRERTELRV
jgi:non-ribosomal peptide synthetase component F